MADLFIHRVYIEFLEADKTEAFLQFCQLSDGLPPSMHSLYQKTMPEDWSPNHRRGTLHIANRLSEKEITLHYNTTDCDNTDFLQALDFKKFGIRSMKGDYYHEYGEYEIGEFTRNESEWSHTPIHSRGQGNLFNLRHNQVKEEIAKLDKDTPCQISFDTDTLREHNGPTYEYKNGVTDEFLEKLIIKPCDYPDWRINNGYQDLEIDVSVPHKLEDFVFSVHKVSDTKFQVRYSGRISVTLSKEYTSYFLKDLEVGFGVQDIMFRFVLDGEEMLPDDHPDLFVDFAMFTPCCNISLIQESK